MTNEFWVSTLKGNNFILSKNVNDCYFFLSIQKSLKFGGVAEFDNLNIIFRKIINSLNTHKTN